MSSMSGRALSAGCNDSARADAPLPELLCSRLPTRPAAKISSESSLIKSSVSFFLDFCLDFVFFFFLVFLSFFFFCDDFEGRTGFGSKAELQEHRSESSSVSPSPMVSDAIYPE